MTTEPNPADRLAPADDVFEVPELDGFDDSSIRRAVRRGVLLTGLVAAAWLLLITVLCYGVGVVVTGNRTGHLNEVVFNGAQVGRPGYAFSGNGCCSDDLGLTFVQTLDLQALGALGRSGMIYGQVRKSPLGTLEVRLPDDDSTPIGLALRRERPTKAGTTGFLATLPPAVSASAIVEFVTPLDEAGWEALPFTDQAPVERSWLLADPYSGPVVSWQNQPLGDFASWVRGLSDQDNDTLGLLGAPSFAELRAAAVQPRVYAVVIARASIADLRTLLANPLVRSVNVAEVGFDPARQSPTD